MPLAQAIMAKSNAAEAKESQAKKRCHAAMRTRPGTLAARGSPSSSDAAYSGVPYSSRLEQMARQRLDTVSAEENTRVPTTWLK